MRVVLIIGMAAALFAGVAQAQTVFTVNLDGAQVPTASAFTGSGTVTLNQAQTQITVSLTHNIPNANVTDAHIHQGAPGVNGGIVFGFPGQGQNPVNEVFSISPAQVAVLQAGDYYVNIHTLLFPNGEIRGQILPQQDTDQDLLVDTVETNTGTFVSELDTGTDPNDQDTDDDGVMDGIEVELGTDPNNALETPVGLPIRTQWILIGVVSLTALAMAMLYVKRPRKA